MKDSIWWWACSSHFRRSPICSSESWTGFDDRCVPVGVGHTTSKFFHWGTLQFPGAFVDQICSPFILISSLGIADSLSHSQDHMREPLGNHHHTLVAKAMLVSQSLTLIRGQKFCFPLQEDLLIWEGGQCCTTISAPQADSLVHRPLLKTG